MKAFLMIQLRAALAIAVLLYTGLAAASEPIIHAVDSIARR